jgi:YegS/Rv2252/BmrU family lipid kinase
MQRNLLFFINPISGKGAKIGLTAQIETCMNRYALRYEIMHTNKEGDYRYLPAYVGANNITDVVICGGDGSVNQVAANLLGVSVQVGIVPLGSGNGLALAAGISKNVKQALELIVHGKADYIDAYWLNDRFSCMLSGIGFDAQVAHDFAKQPTRGLSTYAKQTIRQFFVAKPYRFEIEANGHTWETDAYFISIANSNQFGNHVTIAPRASLKDGKLDIVVVSKTNKLNFVYALLKQIRFGKLSDVAAAKNKTIQYFHTDSIRIGNTGLAPLHIDGEAVHTEARFHARIIPRAIQLIQPAGA